MSESKTERTVFALPELLSEEIDDTRENFSYIFIGDLLLQGLVLVLGVGLDNFDLPELYLTKGDSNKYLGIEFEPFFLTKLQTKVLKIKSS